VATSLHNLAKIYVSQGKYAEAESCYERSLKICEKEAGSEHPDVVCALENIAECCRKMGKYEEAERVEARVKKIRSNK
jgi:tetratricopeptide (TPR) repeat protein